MIHVPRPPRQINGNTEYKVDEIISYLTQLAELLERLLPQSNLQADTTAFPEAISFSKGRLYIQWSNGSEQIIKIQETE